VVAFRVRAGFRVRVLGLTYFHADSRREGPLLDIAVAGNQRQGGPGTPVMLHSVMPLFAWHIGAASGSLVTMS